MKFVIHNSDTYYPGADEFDSLEEAIKSFKKLREKRAEAVADAFLNIDPYFSTDYLCIVIDEIDLKKMISERKKEQTNEQTCH